METIKLPESELAEMKQFYQDELDRTARRLQHIRTILQRLGVNAEFIETSIQADQGKPAEEIGPSLSTVPRTKKRTGRKSKWELLIMKRLL